MQAKSGWDIDEADFPRKGPPETRAWFALRYATLAPSSHNSQPWRFMVDGDTISLLADRTRSLPVVDPYDRELLISCGAALLNLRAALAHFGHGFAINLFPTELEPDLLARVRETLQTDPYPQLLIRVGRSEFAAHTPRRPFDQVTS